MQEKKWGKRNLFSEKMLFFNKLTPYFRLFTEGQNKKIIFFTIIFQYTINYFYLLLCKVNINIPFFLWISNFASIS